MPGRSKLLPIGALVLLIILSYLYVFERPVLSRPLWHYMRPSDEDVPNHAGQSSSKYGFNETQRSRGDVVMVTASSGVKGFLGIPGLKEMVYQNRMSYADKWGYEFMWANITSYDFGPAIYWNKIPILKEAFLRYPNASWVWWLDMDAIIMNMSIDVYDHVLTADGMKRNFIGDVEMPRVGGGPSGHKSPKDIEPDDVNCVISYDNWGINVGSFLIRRSEWADWLLELWATPLATAQNWVFPENDGFVHMWQNHRIVKEHTGITSQRALNAYPEYNALGEHWQQGDFLIHFAGCGNHTRCSEEWNKYYAQRGTYEVPQWIEDQIVKGTAEIENVQKGDYLV